MDRFLNKNFAKKLKMNHICLKKVDFAFSKELNWFNNLQVNHDKCVFFKLIDSRHLFVASISQTFASHTILILISVARVTVLAIHYLNKQKTIQYLQLLIIYT